MADIPGRDAAPLPLDPIPEEERSYVAVSIHIHDTETGATVQHTAPPVQELGPSQGYIDFLESQVRSLANRNQAIMADLMGLRKRNLRLCEDNHHLSNNLQLYIDNLLSQIFALNIANEHRASERIRLEGDLVRAGVRCVATEARLDEAQERLIAQEKEIGILKANTAFLQERCAALKLIYDKTYEHPETASDDGASSEEDGEYELDPEVAQANA